MVVAIVDNDTADAVQLEQMLAGYAMARDVVIQTRLFASGETFLEQFRPGLFDMVFMDIFMDGMTGAEAAALLRARDVRCLLIFLTTSQEHMPDAFACHAFDYIQKPAEEERIFRLMDDAVRAIPGAERYLEFTSSRQTARLAMSDIAAAQTEGHYIRLTDRVGRTFVTRLTFSELLEKLEGDGRFLTINRGVLVNMDEVTAFQRNNCLLACGLALPVKIRSARQIERQWQDWSFRQIRQAQRRREDG